MRVRLSKYDIFEVYEVFISPCGREDEKDRENIKK